MRLIDADALLDKTVKKNRAWYSITNSEGKNLEEIVSEMPSVNPQEPKADRLYNDIYDHYLCGNCKMIVMDYDNFCPNCGARMTESEG